MNDPLFSTGLALTFDDILVVPGYSETLPADVDIRVDLAPGIRLNIPILSAAMDTVTEAPLAIALARVGGLGVLHRNLSPEAQAGEVEKVKQAPAYGPGGKSAGNEAARSPEATSGSAFPHAAADGKGRLLAAAAVGVGADLEARVDLLVKAGVDAVVIDTAHGHSAGVIRAIRILRSNWPGLALIVGNVVTAEGTDALIDAGTDVVKVGVGAGSICTTRVVAGAGMPQASAVYDCARAAQRRGKTTIADGGIKFSGDIVKAIACGAHAVMLGSLLAGLDETPGELVTVDGRLYKAYRGMGSLGAMQGYGKDRYGSGQSGSGKTVPEGIEGSVLSKGCLDDFVHQLTGGLRSGMGYAGAANLGELRGRARLVRITPAGLVESHPHDVQMIRDAPNYSRS